MKSKALMLILALLALGACDPSKIKKEASYPTRVPGTDKILYSDQKRDTIWGEGRSFADFLSGRDQESAAGAALGVNSYLWRASLDTLSFMPIAAADPFGGTIITEWYENPDTPGERFKINVYILDRQLRADGIRVSVFKQTQQKGAWKDAKVADSVATHIENAILTRARDLRVAAESLKKSR